MQSLLCFELFGNIYYNIKVYYKEKNISKLNNTRSEKQTARSDQSSLSFRVGHCHRQLIGINMYITNIKSRIILSSEIRNNLGNESCMRDEIFYPSCVPGTGDHQVRKTPELWGSLMSSCDLLSIPFFKIVSFNHQILSCLFSFFTVSLFYLHFIFKHSTYFCT